MRAVWGLLGLVVVLAMVGVLARKSWHAGQESLARQTQSVPAGHNRAPEAAQVGDQARQVQQQYRQQLASALNAQRPVPDQAQ
ncbi:hypothetical protein [Comamonas guangdongensis]|uniref:Uncharacterized protein n=1 Tax=Comamonas guangdongensis TaxID=510515 RepID=A0ABV3ZV18_9BURK